MELTSQTLKISEDWTRYNCCFSISLACKTGWYTWRGQCYKFFTESASGNSSNAWHNAKDACMAESAMLSSINSAEEMDFVKSIAEKHYPASKFYIGLSYGVHGHEWADNSATFYTHFGHGYGVTKKIVCFPNQLSLTCPLGKVLRIHRANFGRTSSNVSGCETEKHILDCISPSSFTIIHSSCHNTTSCTVNQSTSVFGDPCPSEKKYIEVDYDCVTDVNSCTVLDPSAGFSWKDSSCNNRDIGYLCKEARQTYAPLDCISVRNTSEVAKCPSEFPQGVACRCSCPISRWRNYRRTCDCSLCSSNDVSEARCCKPQSGYSPGPDYRPSVECLEIKNHLPHATCPTDFPTATDCSCSNCVAAFEITTDNRCNCTVVATNWTSAQCCRIVYTPRATGEFLIERYLRIDGIVVDGHDDWTPSNVTSEKECLQACEDQVGCNSVEFLSSQFSTCKLSRSSIKHVGTSGLLQQQPGYTYYERLDGEGDMRNYFQKFDGVYIAGVNTIASIAQLTLSSCMTLCLEDKSCKSADFDDSGKICYKRDGNSFDGNLVVSRYFYHFDFRTNTPDPLLACDNVKSDLSDGNQFSCGAIATWMDHFTYVQDAGIYGYNDEQPAVAKNECLKRCHNSIRCKTIDFLDKIGKNFICDLSYSDRFTTSAYSGASGYAHFEHFIFDSYRGNYVRDSFLKVEGHSIADGIIKVFSGKDVQECMQLCFDDALCKSFNLLYSTGNCLLSNVTRHSQPAIFLESQYDYYEFIGRRAFPTDCSCSTCASHDFLNNVTGCLCRDPDNWGMALCCHAKTLRRPPCKPGTFSPTGYHGKVRCTQCPNGTFSPNVGSTECQMCPEGYYSAQGQTQCTACNYDKTSDISRTRCEPCRSGHTPAVLGVCVAQFKNYRGRPDFVNNEVSDVLPETSKSTADACRRFCEQAASCIGFSYNSVTRACSPKKYVGINAKQNENENGTVLYDRPATLPWNCEWIISTYVAEPNLTFAVGPLPLHNCSLQCINGNCAGFYISRHGYCVLVSLTPSDLGTFNSDVAVHGTNFGWDYFTRKCTQQKQQTSTISMLSGKSITGHTISSITVPTALICAATCLEHMHCKSFSFSEGLEPNCILKDIFARDLKFPFQEDAKTVVYNVVYN